MKSILLFCILTLVLNSLFVLGKLEEEDGLSMVKDENFEKALNKFSKLLVIFTAHFNEESINVAKELAKANDKIKVQYPNFKVVRCEYFQAKETHKKFGIQQLPAIFYFEGPKKKYTYQGGYRDNEFLNWVQNRVDDTLTLIQDEVQMTDILKQNELVVVYFPEGDSKSNLTEFHELSKTFNDIKFAYTTNTNLRDQYKAKHHDVKLFKQFNSTVDTLEGKITFSNLQIFFDKYSYGDVMKYDVRTRIRIFSKVSPAIVLFSDNSPKGESITKTFYEVAQSSKGKILFVDAKETDGSYGQIRDFFGVSLKQKPCIRIIGFHGGETRYKYEGDFSKKSIEKFISSFRIRKLVNYKKSEDIPDNSQNLVKIFVRDNYEDEVINSDKDVFLDLWAPWCSACKNFEPVLEDIAKAFQDYEGVYIGKLNTEANEVPEIELQGLPTLNFYKSGQKDTPIKLEVGKTADYYIEEIKKNLSSFAKKSKSKKKEKTDL